MIETPQVYGKVIALMADCSAISKDGHNKHFKYNFRGIDQVLNTIGPLLRKHGLIAATSVSNMTVTVPDGKKVVTTAVFTVTFYAEDGSSIATSVIGQDQDEQGKGGNKANSAGYKYAILLGLCIPVDEGSIDDGDYDHEPRQERREPQRGRPSAKPGKVKSVNREWCESATVDQLKPVLEFYLQNEGDNGENVRYLESVIKAKAEGK